MTRLQLLVSCLSCIISRHTASSLIDTWSFPQKRGKDGFHDFGKKSTIYVYIYIYVIFIFWKGGCRKKGKVDFTEVQPHSTAPWPSLQIWAIERSRVLHAFPSTLDDFHFQDPETSVTDFLLQQSNDTRNWFQSEAVLYSFIIIYQPHTSWNQVLSFILFFHFVEVWNLHLHHRTRRRMHILRQVFLPRCHPGVAMVIPIHGELATWPHLGDELTCTW